MKNVKEYISGVKSIPWISLDELNNKIFFQQTSVKIKSNKRISEIFELDLDSKKITKVTIGSNDSIPKISPDGKFLAFIRSTEISKGKKRNFIFIKDFTKDREFQLTDDFKSVNSSYEVSGLFNWDNSSSRIVYSFRSIERNDDLNPLVVNRIRYRHDALGWVGDVFNQIEIINIFDRSVISIPNIECDHINPVFSNNDKFIAFISDEGEKRDTNWIQRVEIFNIHLKEISKIKQSFGGLFSLIWTENDSQIIAFGSNENKYADQRTSSLFSLNIKNSEMINLNTNEFAFNSQPNLTCSSTITVSYTSRGISFITDFDFEKNDFKVLLGMDSKILQIANGEFNKNVIFVQNSRDFHENICIYNRDSRSINSLYSPNKDFFQKHPVSKMEKFEINRLNYQIESRLYFPKEIDFSKKYPVIVDIHGGPHGRFEDQISISQEIFTSNNFIVLAVNPRGSSSYGFNFLKEVLNDWGGEDYLDILESIERLSKFNFIDFRKIGLYGHSYGGFMSSWIIGHSKKFKAAVISAPCINLNSMSGTSDIGIKFGEEQWGGIRTFNTEKHLFHSPLSYVENVETPALILCGDADYRCPIEQAEQYYVALKRLDKNVQFVRYPEQNHQMLNIGNPNFIIDYWKRTIKFFNEYLN